MRTPSFLNSRSASSEIPPVKRVFFFSSSARRRVAPSSAHSLSKRNFGKISSSSFSIKPSARRTPPSFKTERPKNSACAPSDKKARCNKSFSFSASYDFFKRKVFRFFDHTRHKTSVVKTPVTKPIATASGRGRR